MVLKNWTKQLYEGFNWKTLSAILTKMCKTFPKTFCKTKQAKNSLRAVRFFPYEMIDSVPQAPSLHLYLSNRSVITCLQCLALFQIRSAARQTTHGWNMHKTEGPPSLPQAPVFHWQHLGCWETLALSPHTLNIPLRLPSNTVRATGSLFTFPDFLNSNRQTLNGLSTEPRGVYCYCTTSQISVKVRISVCVSMHYAK